MRTAVIGIDSLIPRTSPLPEWNVAMPAANDGPAAAGGGHRRHEAVVVKGLVETEP